MPCIWPCSFFIMQGLKITLCSESLCCMHFLRPQNQMADCSLYSNHNRNDYPSPPTDVVICSWVQRAFNDYSSMSFRSIEPPLARLARLPSLPRQVYAKKANILRCLFSLGRIDLLSLPLSFSYGDRLGHQNIETNPSTQRVEIVGN